MAIAAGPGCRNVERRGWSVQDASGLITAGRKAKLNLLWMRRVFEVMDLLQNAVWGKK